jgi:hypothetical protein
MLLNRARSRYRYRCRPSVFFAERFKGVPKYLSSCRERLPAYFASGESDLLYLAPSFGRGHKGDRRQAY